VKRRQIIGQLVVGAGIVALLAACGSDANATRVGGIPTSVVGATGGQIVFAPTTQEWLRPIYPVYGGVLGGNDYLLCKAGSHGGLVGA